MQKFPGAAMPFCLRSFMLYCCGQQALKSEFVEGAINYKNAKRKN